MGTRDDGIEFMFSRFMSKRAMSITQPEDCAQGIAQVNCLKNVTSEDGECPAKLNDATSLKELQKIRHEGNRLFAEKNWAAAINQYSNCINQTLCTVSDSSWSLLKTSQENSSRCLMLAYSNRAEARLRLLHYEDAFSDVQKALEIEPMHVKTLVRKGRAAHGLGLFEEACKAFKAALAKSPEEQSIGKDLLASITALKQSCTGQYDLSDFFLRGCAGEVPSCADFVGPVEIRRVGYGHGRRGLFATRNLEPGELLLLSNPLTVFRQNFPVSYDSSAMRNAERNLIPKLLKLTRTHATQRQMAQLYSLCGFGKDEMDIPSMDLFRAGSEYLPEGWERTTADADRIREIVQFNLQNGHPAPSETILGIWALPSFANHSCSPNICRTYVGDAVSFRSSENIAKGEELTISYFGEAILLNNCVKARQTVTSKNWFFTCKCARCLLEESLEPKLSKINKALSDFLETRDAEVDSGNVSVNQELTELANEVEGVILSHCSKLGPKPQGWIRATFFLPYTTKLALTMEEGDLESRQSGLGLLLNSMTAVCVGPVALTHATFQLELVEVRYGKHSQIYKLTFERVSRIYKIYFGDQPKAIVRKLIKVIFLHFGGFLDE